MKKLKILLASLFFVLLPSGLALAHATPLLYEPDGSSILKSAPDKITIEFSEHVEPKASSITVYAPDGSNANLGSGSVDPKDSRYFSVPLKNSGQGSYAVSWEVVSADDGHFTQGAYVFSVGLTSQNPNQPAQTGFQIQHSSSIPEGVIIALELIGEALFLGLLIITACLWRPMRGKYFAADLEKASSETVFLKRLSLSLAAAFILVSAGVVSYLIFKSDELAKLQSTAFGPTFWLFFTTQSARWALYRLIAVTVGFAVFFIGRKKIISSAKLTGAEIFCFAALAFCAYARAKISHAAASEFHPQISIVINFIHLYFKDLWIGGILALLILLAPAVKKVSNLKVTAFILTRFSQITAVALGVGGITGVYIVWLHLKSFNNILTTGWGQTFLLLSVFAGLFVLARIFHQLILEPALVKNQNRAKKLLEWLPITFAFEAGIGICILAVTSILIITTPPISLNYNFQRQAVSRGVNISLTQDPYEDSKLLVTLTDSKTNQPLDVNNLIVTLTNSDKNIGPITAITQQRFLGGYIFDENQLTPSGNWQLGITAQRDNAYDANTTFNLNFPDDINYAKAHAQDRRFDGFAALCLATALLLIVAAALLYRFSSELNRKVIYEADKHLTLSTDNLLYGRGAWAIPLVVSLFILMFLGGMPGMGLPFLQSGFEKECEKNANITLFMWHESVPERAGQATSDLAQPGCLVGMGLGQYHFADQREFEYFTRTAEAQADLKINPQKLSVGQPATLTFSIKDFEGNPVTDLSLDHDRILHVIIVSSDFSVFAHVHAEDSGPITPDMLKNAQFPVHYTFPKAGKYLVAVDFTERAKPFYQEFYVNVAGLPTQSEDQQDFLLNREFDGYDVKLTTSPYKIKTGQPVTLNYHIEKDNQQVIDLEPYLAVPMHISVVSEDQINYIHLHGMLPLSFPDQLSGQTMNMFLPNKFGPNITASLTFPRPGVYHIFGEFKRMGKTTVTDFMVKVE